MINDLNIKCLLDIITFMQYVFCNYVHIFTHLGNVKMF